jgi:hypothetical protein
MVLDSSGSSDGERRMAVGKCARRLWLECVTATRWKLPMAKGTVPGDYFRMANHRGAIGFGQRCGLSGGNRASTASSIHVSIPLVRLLG